MAAVSLVDVSENLNNPSTYEATITTIEQLEAILKSIEDKIGHESLNQRMVEKEKAVITLLAYIKQILNNHKLNDSLPFAQQLLTIYLKLQLEKLNSNFNFSEFLSENLEIFLSFQDIERKKKHDLKMKTKIANIERLNKERLEKERAQSRIDLIQKEQAEKELSFSKILDLALVFKIGYLEFPKVEFFAFDLLVVLASKGSSEALYHLGDLLQNGTQIEHDFLQAAEFYRLASELGNLNGKFRLARMFLYGIGVPKNEEHAYKMLCELDTLGHSNAQITLGHMFENGNYVEKNIDRAYQLYKKAADQGNPEGTGLVANCLLFGLGVARDPKQAFELASQSASGAKISQVVLGIMYREGVGVVQDLQLAYQWNYKAAIQDDEAAQFNLASMFEKGEHVTQNFAEAFKWYEKSANLDHQDAKYQVAKMLSLGEGVTKDEVRAVKLLRSLADKGHKAAQFTLGSHFLEGAGVPINPKLAAELFLKSGLPIDVNTQNNLGHCFYYGTDTAQDIQQAIFWYRKAAMGGCIEAQAQFAALYLGNELPESDKKQALEWLKNAADHNHARAQCNLAMQYDIGKLLPKNTNLAITLYKKSADQGYAIAQTNLAVKYSQGIIVPQDLKLAVEYARLAALQNYPLAKTMYPQLQLLLRVQSLNTPAVLPAPLPQPVHTAGAERPPLLPAYKTSQSKSKDSPKKETKLDHEFQEQELVNLFNEVLKSKLQKAIAAYKDKLWDYNKKDQNFYLKTPITKKAKEEFIKLFQDIKISEQTISLHLHFIEDPKNKDYLKFHISQVEKFASMVKIKLNEMNMSKSAEKRTSAPVAGAGAGAA